VIVLADVYDNRNAHLYLWDMLGDRSPDQSISHKDMPTWDDHVDFVASRPYTNWYFIQENHYIIGQIYINEVIYPNKTLREVGISLCPGNRGQGHGTKALELLMEAHPGELHANINPDNKASIKFFKKFGFKLIQHTYIHE